MKLIQLGGHRYKNKPVRGYTMVDDEDFERVNVFEWHLNDKGYAVRRPHHPKKTIRLHRFIMNPTSRQQIDHVDGNKLNNQKYNLRLCNNAENMRNRGKYRRNQSGYKGVWWHTQIGRWAANLRLNGKTVHLGIFDNKKEAAKAYNQAAIKYFGAFANLNVL